MTSRGASGLRRARALLLLSLLAQTAFVYAQPRVPSGPVVDPITRCQDYPSTLLGGHLRICDGTPWPAPTEKDVMPLMRANRHRFKGKTVLDLGTGSGILALYAAKLGAAKVIATDIEPKALDCARENARRFGLDTVLETRLVSLKDPSAYAVIKPGEVFDVIVAAPPHRVNRVPFVASGAVDEGIGPNDYLRLGLSIVNGLGKHLSQNGAAILIYRSAVLHDILVAHARHLGFVVDHHPTQLLMGSDWVALYNSFAAQVARAESIAPDALLLPRPPEPADSLGIYVKFDYMGERGGVFSRLWEDSARRVIPGMIVIRKKGSGEQPH